MDLRPSRIRKDGKTHTYWRRVRSVRRQGKVVQESVAQHGELDAEGRAKARALARTITGCAEQRELFEDAARIEAAFRIHKSELGLRPIWHQKAERAQAHLLMCFLGYVLWKTLEQWQKRAGLGHSPRTILDERAKLGQQKTAALSV